MLRRVVRNPRRVRTRKAGLQQLLADMLANSAVSGHQGSNIKFRNDVAHGDAPKLVELARLPFFGAESGGGLGSNAAKRGRPAGRDNVPRKAQ